MASPHGPTYFLTFNGKKYHPSLEWNDEDGLLQDPSNHAPHSSKKDFKVSSFFFCFLLVNLLISCFVENFMVGHCHVVVVCSCENFGHCMIGGESLCDHVDFIFLGHFWIVELFGIVKFGQCWWFMKFCIVCSFWYCWMNFDFIYLFICGYEIMIIWCVGMIE